jgi:hypothetical protein
MRAEVGDASSNLAWQWVQPRRPAQAVPEQEIPDDARVFGGSHDGDARGTTFVGPEEPVGADPVHSGAAR